MELIPFIIRIQLDISIIIYGRVEIIILETGKIIIHMNYLTVKEYVYIITEIFTKGILRMEKNMGKGNYYIQMDWFSKIIGKTEVLSKILKMNMDYMKKCNFFFISIKKIDL